VERSADVVVVELGAVRSAVLYQLADRSIAAIGIDRFAPPHDQGSSHGESRITRLAVSEGPEYVPFVRRSHELWRKIGALTDQTLIEEVGAVFLSPADTEIDSSACSGHGFKHGAALGEAIAAQLAGDLAKAKLLPFALSRLQRRGSRRV
jgi:glycine/D-amino acid oxidase-like deaminating enzyme